MKEQMQQRLQRQEEEERQAKSQLTEKAASHLESFYQVSAQEGGFICCSTAGLGSMADPRAGQRLCCR